MKKVTIDPGVCANITTVTAETSDGMTVTLTIDSSCAAVSSITEKLGNEFSAYEICFAKPGSGALYDYARENFPAHGACPAIAGIIKCMEAECGLALPKNASITIE